MRGLYTKNMTTELGNAKVTSAVIYPGSDEDLKFLFDGGSSGDTLNHLGHINLFIGQNNSGKSQLMRRVANTFPQQFAYNLAGFNTIDNLLAEMQTEFVEFLKDRQAQAIVEINANNRINLHQLNFTKYSFTHIKEGTNPLAGLAPVLRAFLDGNITVGSYRGGNPGDDWLRRAVTAFIEPFRQRVEVLLRLDTTPGQIPVCYIPTLRSLNNFKVGGGDDKDDFIALRIRQNYGLDRNKVDIFTGQTIYERVKSMLLGDQSERDKIASYEHFLSENLFNGQQVNLIPKVKSDVIEVKIGDEERPIYELGDGIQSLIILTFPLFEYDHGIFFMEEPEQNLHPGMQRKLLDVLQAKKQHQFFLTSHSNHFLDLTIQYKDVSLYRCRKQSGKCETEIVGQGDRSLLEEIGVQNTSVFLTNKTIWVEGVTDRYYISKFVNLYIKKHGKNEIYEDIDFSFVEYGGNNITHWSFVDKLAATGNSITKINAQRLCGQMIVIADADSMGSKTRRKDTLKAELGERFIEIGAREIENLLPAKVLETVVDLYERQPTLLFEGITQSKYASESLGTYINGLFETKSIAQHRTSYADDSGTIKDKVAFSRKALGKLTGFDDLPIGAQQLAEQIYKFVTSET
jgi:AAA15 family ATPase/GTPase